MTLWTPAEITTALWLDAADIEAITLDTSGNVEQLGLNDGGSLAQAVEANRPGYLAQDGLITGNGTDRFLSDVATPLFSDIPDGTVNEYTFFLVCKPNKTSSGSKSQSSSGTDFYSYDSYNNVAFYIRGNTSDKNGPVEPVFSITTNYISMTVTRNSLAPFNVCRAHSVGNNLMMVMFEQKTNGTIRSGINGSYANGAPSSITNLSWYRTVENNGVRIPARYTTNSCWNGGIGEAILIHNGNLSAEVIQQIEGYLAWKWGLVGYLPLEHPYKEAAPTLPGEEVIEDISLDFSAYYQARDNLSAILSVTDGTAFQDLEAILKIHGQSIENLPAELAAYFQDQQDIATALKTLATGYKNLPTALKAMGLGRADLPAQLKTLAWTGKDLSMMLAAVTPLVIRDLGLSLSATDGTTINDLSIILAAVKRAPQYRSVVAQRVRSVISEVM